MMQQQGPRPKIQQQQQLNPSVPAFPLKIQTPQIKTPSPPPLNDDYDGPEITRSIVLEAFDLGCSIQEVPDRLPRLRREESHMQPARENVIGISFNQPATETVKNNLQFQVASPAFLPICEVENDLKKYEMEEVERGCFDPMGRMLADAEEGLCYSFMSHTIWEEPNTLQRPSRKTSTKSSSIETNEEPYIPVAFPPPRHNGGPLPALSRVEKRRQASPLPAQTANGETLFRDGFGRLRVVRNKWVPTAHLFNSAFGGKDSEARSGTLCAAGERQKIVRKKRGAASPVNDHPHHDLPSRCSTPSLQGPRRRSNTEDVPRLTNGAVGVMGRAKSASPNGNGVRSRSRESPPYDFNAFDAKPPLVPLKLERRDIREKMMGVMGATAEVTLESGKRGGINMNSVTGGIASAEIAEMQIHQTLLLRSVQESKIELNLPHHGPSTTTATLSTITSTAAHSLSLPTLPAKIDSAVSMSFDCEITNVENIGRDGKPQVPQVSEVLEGKSATTQRILGRKDGGTVWVDDDAYVVNAFRSLGGLSK
ncbi:hypothetical protein HDU67_007048 [Dinochytrium kinnereticum]|nr:hypothetical protein HDU67_007048 [Dinochytrium kinnereticum]